MKIIIFIKLNQFFYKKIKKKTKKSNSYPLESYVTYMSHRILQGAPTESRENSSIGRIPLRIRKDKKIDSV